MISAAQLRSRPGPLARTRQEVLDIERRARFRREQLSRARLRLRESDALLDLVEQCRLLEIRPLPPSLWHAVVRMVGAVEPELRDQLGITRDADLVSDVIFTAQEKLQEEARGDRRPQLARIIPLFPSAEG
ncbi:MAG: hypothetical protein WCB85_04180 [Candidatus Dormiibacterota bacterium]